MDNEKTQPTTEVDCAVHRESDELLREAIEFLKFQTDPRHSRRPKTSDIREWIDRCREYLCNRPNTL